MTFGQLFREVVREVDGEEFDEKSFQYADTIVPSVINEEVPPEHLDAVRAELLKQCREHSARMKTMSQAELQAELNQFLSKN